MKISLNWLQDYVKIDVRPDELADRLTMTGLEVESIKRMQDVYKDFIVGEVKSVDKHPRADRLTVCSVHDGNELFRVVCGAPNVRAGQKVVFAKVGSVVPANSMEVKSVEIRGEQSHGMICSEYELDLGPDHDGILVLPDDAPVGEKFSSYFWWNDVVFEIGVTPNRPDCLSHIGVAREVAALYKEKLQLPKIQFQESKKTAKNEIEISIVDPDHCPRYVGRIVRDTTVQLSPEWMQRRLLAIDLRPINSIVDVTNYVLMEYGQPLHAFDYELLKGKKIVVRLARNGERFTTLDEKHRTLSEQNLLICDGERPVAIGGVMGGLNTEISSTTTSVLIESAFFSPSSIRRTSKQLGLSTESSYRFERGVDPSKTAEAADRAAQLIQQISGGAILKGRVDVYLKKIRPRIVRFNTKEIKRVIGVSIPASTARSIFKYLGVEVQKRGGGKWVCKIPTYRPDLEREIDLVEEVARIYGFDLIPAQEEAHLSFAIGEEKVNVEYKLREWFLGAGFNEVICNSMVPEKWAILGGKEPAIVTNPQNRDMAALRTSLIPGMLQVVKHNRNRGNENLRLYEIGHIFSKSNFPGGQMFIRGYFEGESCALVLTGLKDPQDWSVKSVVNFFDIKGEIESIFQHLRLDKNNYNVYYIGSNTLIEGGLSIEMQGIPRGYLGKVQKEILDIFDIEDDVYVAELDLSLFEEVFKHRRLYQELPKYPPVYRDLAFVLDEEIPYSKLEVVVQNAGLPLLKEVTFFDIYRGEKIGKGRKSIAVSLELLSQEKTLTQTEIDTVVRNIIKAVESELGATLRS